MRPISSDLNFLMTPPDVANIGGYWLQLKCAKIQTVKQASKQHTSTASSTVPEVRFLTPCPDFLGRWTMKNHCKLKSLKSTLSSLGWFWCLIIAIETQECSWIIKSTKLEWVWYSFLVFLYFDIGSSAINLVWMKKTHFFFLGPENHNHLSGTTHTAQTDKWLLPEQRRKPFYKFIGWVKSIRAHGHIGIVSEKPSPKVTST